MSTPDPAIHKLVVGLSPPASSEERVASAASLTAQLEAAENDSPAAFRRTAEALVVANAVLPLLLMVQEVERDANTLALLPVSVPARLLSPAIPQHRAPHHTFVRDEALDSSLWPY